MEYDKTINEDNVKKFSVSDIFDYTDNEKFKCIICGRKVSVLNSSSIMGHYLVCYNCAYEKFGDYAKVRKWQKQLIDEEVKQCQN